MKENKRQCFKCGASPSVNPRTNLHRFPKPGKTNKHRCELWAKFCFPNGEWQSPKFQNKLYTEHRMLCSGHFNKVCFIDAAGTKLFKSATPDEEISIPINMENRTDPSTGEACAKEGRAFDDVRHTRQKRKAARSSSSESSSSASSKEYDHKWRSRSKRKRRNCKSNKLMAKTTDLENKISKPVLRGSIAPDDYSSCDVDPDISGDLYCDEPVGMQPRGTTGLPKTAVPHSRGSDPQFDFTVSTKVKEPSVPQTSSAYLEHLKALQHFEQADWNNVRYIEAQKQYVHAPGFTSLELNAEISNYDSSDFRAHMETAFSGLTFALLKQSETIRNDMREFLNWVKQEEQPNYTAIFEKMNNIFTNGEYPKITSDLFQMTCGHRAELIKYRRDSILACVKDPIYKEALKKIPPSCSTLFEEEKFTAVLDKAGGVSNTFWPRIIVQTTSAPQSYPGMFGNQAAPNEEKQSETISEKWK